LCIHRKSFSLDCFIFVLLDRETVAERQKRLQELDGYFPLLYLEEGLFYNQITRPDGKRSLHLKCNRTIAHWTKMRYFLKILALLLFSGFLLWSVPLGAIVISNAVSNEYFGINYDYCLELPQVRSYYLDAKSSPQAWPTLSRATTFVLDIIDSSWLLFDTSNAMVWPFASLIIIAQDANFSLESLIKSVDDITLRNQQLQLFIHRSNREARESEKEMDLYRKLIDQVEEDALVIRGEIVDFFKQLNLADQFVSKLSAFCIYVWVLSNVYYEFVSLYQHGALAPNSLVQYMQMGGFFGISITFAFIARAHTKSLKLHRRICNLVALDPDHRGNKSSWLWVLEYYEHEKSYYTFHMGSSTNLSFLGYLRSMSWFVTVACVVLNLMHLNLSLGAHKLGNNSNHID